MRIRVNSKESHFIDTTEHFIFKYVPTVYKPQSKDKIKYLQQPAFLDTETSHNHDEENPIGWIYQFCLEFNNQVVIGREPFQLLEYLEELKELYKLDETKRLVLFVHNLSYDYVYLYQFLAGIYGEPKILAVKTHKILTAQFGCFEFRCSYLLSNMSLSVWAEKLKCNVTKMVGAVDYDVIRYQDSELTATDWEYMLNDVLTLKECVYREMLFNKDNVATIPLTSTGFVRRDCRRSVSKDKTYRKWFTDTKLTPEQYKIARRTFAGGLTHGNRFYGGKTVLDVGHVDKKSHYPSCQMLEYFPMGKWLHYFNYQIDGVLPDSEFNELLNTKCVLFTMSFNNLRLKKGVTCPCISKHKVVNFPFVTFTNDFGAVGTDNGKIVNAYGDVILSLTELDYYWLLQQYETDGHFIMDVFISDRGYIKKSLTNTINNYFIGKETLKAGVLRDKSKNKLNAIYGMSATDMVRSEISFDFTELKWNETKNLEDDYIIESLNKYYKSRNSFNNYTHGVYTTSWARYILLDIIQNIVGYENFLYCDTDSVFYKESDEIEEKIKQYNEEQIKRNIERGFGVQNSKGSISYYGTLEHEEHCREFRFLHSKCYCLVDDDGGLHVTIAGVTKDNKQPKGHPGRVTIQEELGSIDNLRDGFIFTECGGTKSKYIETPVRFTNINGHDIIYASACIITQTTKELGGTVEGFEEWEML